MIHYSVTRDYSITHLVSRAAFFPRNFIAIAFSWRYRRNRAGKKNKPGKGGEGWEEVQVQGKENGKTWLRRRSFESLLFGMDVLSLLSSSTRIKHGGNTFEFEIGGDTYEEAR